jgi:thiol-disulfide isomerase/thioredoxin
MKKTSLILLFTLYFTSSVTAQEKEGINFRAITFDQAIQQAKAEKKPIFLHAFASWCHFCEFMVDSVYKDQEVAAYYNKNYICIKMDMEKEGREFNKKIKVKNYPTHVFFDYNNTVMMHRSAGKKSTAEFLQLGKDAQDTTKQLRTFERKYFDKKANIEEITTYMKMLEKAGLDNQVTINAYLSGLSEKEMLKHENWRIMYDLFKEVETTSFQKVMYLREEYAKIYTADSIDNKIISLYNSALMNRVQKLDTSGYNTMVEKLRKSDLDLSEKIIAYASLNRHKMRSDWKNYQLEAVPFIEKYCMEDYRRLNEVAYNFYERITDKELLAKAETWAVKAVSLQDNIRNNHTLSGIYFKLGKKEPAMTACKHTIDLAKKANVDYKQSSLLLEKIEEMKSLE